MGLTYAIAIVLPVVTTFFLLFGFLEDSGYIPRLAIFSDRIFRAMGLNGKAVLPMVLGLGCDTMATMTTRILATPKERLIAILLLALGIPCSAQLATILGILGGVSFAALAHALRRRRSRQMFVVGWLAGAAAARASVRSSSWSCRRSGWPRLRNLRHEDADARVVVSRRGGAAVPRRHGAAVRPRQAGRARRDRGCWTARSSPACSGCLPATAQILVMGFLRRDYGAAGLFQLAHTGQLHRRAGCRRLDGDDAVRAVRRQFPDDCEGARHCGSAWRCSASSRRSRCSPELD